MKKTTLPLNSTLAEDFPRAPLELPEGYSKDAFNVLLHTCCAPCSGEIMAAMQEDGIQFTAFFYNPNIHPQEEYLIRKEENIRYAKKFGIPFIDADYDPERWFERTKGLEDEPERGKRCSTCFDMRLTRTAQYAHEHSFQAFTTSLGISRWKDMEQVYASGKAAASQYPHLLFWDYNWRKKGGSQRMLEISKAEQFYKQEYCGCAYSLRDSNAWRVEQGRAPIQRGDLFYDTKEPTKKST